MYVAPDTCIVTFDKHRHPGKQPQTIAQENEVNANSVVQATAMKKHGRKSAGEQKDVGGSRGLTGLLSKISVVLAGADTNN
ncbi:MAG: hypothetical protein V1874_11030 [Spirochaetota bacterium]